MKKPAKTVLRITWKDGRTETVRRTSSGYRWGPQHGNLSSHLDNLRLNVESMGGTLERIPNPDYERDLERWAKSLHGKRVSNHLGRALLGDLWGDK